MLQNKPVIRLRLAVPSDGRPVWLWRNDSLTRRFSFNTGKVPLAGHQAWFEGKLKQANSRLYIVEDAKRHSLGQVRVEKTTRGIGYINIGLDARARGRGVGLAAIKGAARRVRRTLGIKTLAARIKPENVGSVTAFLKAGFHFIKVERVQGSLCYRLELSL